MLTRRQILAAGALSALGGCVTAPAPPRSDDGGAGGLSSGPAWSMIGFDTANTGYDPEAVGPDGENGDIATLWQQPLAGDWTPRPPSGEDGFVYTQLDTYVYAFNATTGDLHWQTDLEYLTYPFTPTIAGDRLYASAIESKDPDTGGKIYGLKRSTGKVVWEYSEPLIDTAPRLIDDTIYFLSQTRGRSVTAHAVDASTGDERWTFPCHDCQEVRPTKRWSPAVVDGIMYLSIPGGTEMYALDTTDRSVLWEESFERPITSAAAVSEDTVFVGDRDGVVYAFDAASGEKRWHHEPETEFGMINATPVVGDGAVVVGGPYRIRAIDAGSGEQRWICENVETNNSSLSIADGTVFSGGFEVTAIDIEEGDIEWWYDVGVYHSLFTGCIVGDGVVYTNSCIKQEVSDPYDHHLRAIGLK